MRRLPVPHDQGGQYAPAREASNGRSLFAWHHPGSASLGVRLRAGTSPRASLATPPSTVLGAYSTLRQLEWCHNGTHPKEVTMEYQAITEAQWRSIQQNGSDIPRIRERAEKLIRNFAALFNEKTPGGVAGVAVTTLPEGEFLGAVLSPFGEGRFCFNLAHHQQAIFGYVVVERKSRDNRDNVIWQPVWSVFVPEQGAIFSGDGEGSSKYNIFTHHSDDASNATFEFGMKVLYSLIEKRGQ